jgi:hypothetical protein
VDALALALAPNLRVESFAVAVAEGSDVGAWNAEVFNETQFAATDVTLEAKFRDGVRVRERIERLAGGAVQAIGLRSIDPPPGGPTPAQAGEELLLRYSDERGIARYELRYLFLSRNLPDGRSIPIGTVVADGMPVRVS